MIVLWRSIDKNTENAITELNSKNYQSEKKICNKRKNKVRIDCRF